MSSAKEKPTREEQFQLDLKRLEKLRPLDDDFMRELFRNNIPLAETVLRIITGIKDLHITSEETQYDLKHLLGARSICLDVLAEDSIDRKYNLEIQRSDKGATPKRARYHSSAIDVEFLKEKQDFDQLLDTYVIFITEKDTIGLGRPVTAFKMRDEYGNPLNDGKHIIFVNGAYNNKGDNSDIAKLIHDFNCNKAEDMQIKLMADRTRYYKEIPEGVKYMCQIMEDMRHDEKEWLAINLIKRGRDSVEEIADLTGLTVWEVEELKNKCGYI